MQSYVKKPSDIAFVKIVETLYSKRHEHLKFKTRKQFLQWFDIADTNYAAIKSGSRGVPNEKLPLIKKLLKERFDVNPNFIEHNQGKMFLVSTPVPAVDTDNIITDNENELLKQQIQSLQFQIKEKNELIHFLQQTIEKQQGLIDGLINKS